MYAGFYDLEHEMGTGNISGIRAGCTANLIAADGVLNALDYTRSCTCSYAQQTSLALVHWPDDRHIENWALQHAAPPDPAGFGLNFGAPGRRVDTATGRIWFHRSGTHRRHPSAIQQYGASPAWVTASGLECDSEETIVMDSLLEAEYTVRLHFAELDAGVAPGERVFDLWINGEPMVRNMDIVARADGAFRPVTKAFRLSVGPGGTLTVILRQTENATRPPLINGIELTASDP